MKEVEPQITDVLRKLPVLPHMDHYVPVAARLLIHNDQYVLKPADYRLRGDKAAIRELTKLAEHLTAAQTILDNLSDQARDALHGELPGIFNQRYYEMVPERTLRGLDSLARSARTKLEAKPVKESARPAQKRHAATIAAIAVGVYEMLTGEKAGITTDPIRRGHPRSGKFLDFVTDLFDALGVDASPEAQAKVALQEKSVRRIDMAFILDHMLKQKRSAKDGSLTALE